MSDKLQLVGSSNNGSFNSDNDKLKLIGHWDPTQILLAVFSFRLTQLGNDRTDVWRNSATLRIE